jgi:hypothetical protein
MTSEKELLAMSTRRSVHLERSLEGLQLGQPVHSLESDGHWYELAGPEKMMFRSGLRDERLFTTETGTPRMCGFLSGKLYKVALMLPLSQADSYVRTLTGKYGKPDRPEGNCWSWEDEATVLEVTTRSQQANVMLTDKTLLIRAEGTPVSGATTRTYTRPRASMLWLRDESKMYDALPAEEWILEAQARLSVKIGGLPAGGTPGFLSVTSKRVVFEPAKTSVTGATVEIALEEIAKVKKTWNLLIFPNSLKIFTRDGTCYKFTTWSRNAIVELLQEEDA